MKTPAQMRKEAIRQIEKAISWIDRVGLGGSPGTPSPLVVDMTEAIDELEQEG